MCTFSKRGFQQIQLDAEFLRMSTAKYMMDDALLSSLLNQLLGSAYKRSLDPVPLETKMLEQFIVNA
jgi:hypothetical protein